MVTVEILLLAILTRIVFPNLLCRPTASAAFMAIPTFGLFLGSSGE